MRHVFTFDLAPWPPAFARRATAGQACTRADVLRQALEALVDLGHRELKLLLAHGVCGAGNLLLEIQPCQFQRLDFPRLLRIDDGLAAGALTLVSFELLHTLLNARLCVDESFSRISQNSLQSNSRQSFSRQSQDPPRRY